MANKIPLSAKLPQGFFSVLPKETYEKIFSYLDGRSVVTCRLVSKKWKETIDKAPWYTLKKVRCNSLILSAYSGGLYISINRKVNREVNEPTRKKALLVIRKGNCIKYYTEGHLKISGMPDKSELSRIDRFLQHITIETLEMKGLWFKGLATILILFKKICLDAKIILFKDCKFQEITRQTIVNFFVFRVNKVEVLILEKCTGLERQFTPAEFWWNIEFIFIKGEGSTLSLSSSVTDPWLTDFVTTILLAPQRLWSLEISGFAISQSSLCDHLINWVLEDPIFKDQRDKSLSKRHLYLQQSNITRKDVVEMLSKILFPVEILKYCTLTDGGDKMRLVLTRPDKKTFGMIFEDTIAHRFKVIQDIVHDYR